MIKLTIDNQTVEVESGTSVLEACKKLNIEVPVFCYHPKLKVAGNCRMCLVEMEKSPKPIASCAMPAAEGMVIHTKTEMVRKAREGNLELLLINHPLDCPICDQGGECDLQDITMSYGRGESRFHLNKRAVTDKYMGPIIKTVMTRCIHCTRCVRFTHEVAGTGELATLHRGEHMEITSFLESAVTSELSGNLVDICPVGALTNKPYAFSGRAWELTKIPSIDVMDAMGAHIRLDVQNGEVRRILPMECEEINETWISDRTRFCYDGLKFQRLDTPYISKKGKLKEAPWKDAFTYTSEMIKGVNPSEIAVLAGPLADVDGLYALKKLMENMGVHYFECRTQGLKLTPACREDYLFNTTIQGIDKADVCLLVGTNPRREASVLNARILKNVLQRNMFVGVVGDAANLTYPYMHLGDRASSLEHLREADHPMTRALRDATNPMIIVGESALIHEDGEKILAFLKDFARTHSVIKKDWNGFNILFSQTGTLGALDLGYIPKNSAHTMESFYQNIESGTTKILYLYGVDDIDFVRIKKSPHPLHIIYQGHHGDAGAASADVIFPGAAFSEKTALYVNMEGRVQESTKATPPPGEAKEDWRILRALSEYLGQILPFDTHEELRAHLVQDFPIFKKRNVVNATPESGIYAPIIDARLAKAKLSNREFHSSITDSYLSNVITGHSPILAECSKIQKDAQKNELKNSQKNLQAKSSLKKGERHV